MVNPELQERATGNEVALERAFVPRVPPLPCHIEGPRDQHLVFDCCLPQFEAHPAVTRCSERCAP